MPAKRKKKTRLPLRSHHPSQSSIDVPAAVKTLVKATQDKRCWLCNRKAHKRHRPLEIYHIFPQAMSKHFHFVMHHKLGRTQLENIHDAANLMALCKICHFAFDNKEWTFLPVNITTWLQEAKAKVKREAEVDGEANINGDFILRYNARRDVEFRRWRLIEDPDSETSRDKPYESAFTDEPIKRWLGEPGVTILGNAAITETPTLLETDEELTNTLDTYGELLRIWRNYKRPCSKGDCQICNDGGDEDSEDNKRDDEDNEDDEDDEDDEGDNGQSDQKRRRISRQGQQDGPSKLPPKSH